MRMLRRLVPRMGFLPIAGLVWGHRGTVRRLVDLAVDAPRLAREDGVGELVRRGRLLWALDRSMPKHMGVRISGVDSGAVTLAGDVGGKALQRATEALCGVEGVTSVRTDGQSHPTADALYASAAS